MKVRKKPVEVEAIRWTWENISEMSKYLNQQSLIVDERGNLMIYTLEGVMRAKVGDWIIKGVQGEFYPITDEIFEKTYEKITENIECKIAM